MKPLLGWNSLVACLREKKRSNLIGNRLIHRRVTSDKSQINGMVKCLGNVQKNNNGTVLFATKSSDQAKEIWLISNTELHFQKVL